ncbi:hypothetical protein [uncultured Anaerovibrio sp.]|uniref:hypothetical protein n=1 Tax=uncultured Anaerovibrio sp. TaxID=361586 RepID=UPI00260EC7E1|nr:hypothetical protein [uncultured Anaerovibrio sp.]
MAAEKETKAQPVAEMDTDMELIPEVVDEKDVITLKKPLPNGNNEIIFNFDKINGYVLLKCEKQARKEDPGLTIPLLSTVFQAFVAAAATKLRYDDIAGLSAPDFIAVTNKTANFLASAGR